MRITGRLAAAITALLVIAGCGADSATSSDGDTLRVAAADLAKSVDPTDELSPSYLRAHGAAEALTRILPNGQVEPELAKSVKQTAPNSWVAMLRDGAEFWSGTPADAKAVVASLERSADRYNLAAGQLKGVTFSATSPRTVTFRTKEPSPTLPYTLAHYSLVIHNAASYQKDPTVADFTGPYRITRFETDREMVLERNPDWWGGTPGVKRVVVQQVADPQSRAQLAIAGQADIVQDVPSDRAEEIEAAPNGHLVSTSAGNTVAVFLNPSSKSTPALADQRVRQALAWAVNREEVCKLATNGLTKPASSWLASSPGFPKAAKQGYVDYDFERAKRLLDAAGWGLKDGQRVKDGRPFTMRLLTFGAEAATGEVLQSQWERLGIEVKFRNVESTLIMQIVEGNDWDAVTQAWTTIGDVKPLLAGQISKDGAGNHGSFDVPEVPRLLEQVSAAPTQSERDEAVYALNQIMADTVPSVPIHPRVVATAVADRVEGFVAHPLQYEQLVRAEVALS